MATLREFSIRLTGVFLVASGYLIGPSLVDLGATLPLAFILLAVGVAVWFYRASIPALPVVSGYRLERYRQALWQGPLLAAGGVLAILGGSPAELQAVGGIAGAAGMANYFLRPLYLSVFGAVRRVFS